MQLSHILILTMNVIVHSAIQGPGKGPSMMIHRRILDPVQPSQPYAGRTEVLHNSK